MQELNLKAMSHRITKSLELHSNETFVVVPSVNIPIRVATFYKGVKPILRVASLFCVMYAPQLVIASKI